VLRICYCITIRVALSYVVCFCLGDAKLAVNLNWFLCALLRTANNYLYYTSVAHALKNANLYIFFIYIPAANETYHS
jgi:hypothetical protein